MTRDRMVANLRAAQALCESEYEASGLPGWQRAAKAAAEATQAVLRGDYEKADKWMRAGQVMLEVGV